MRYINSTSLNFAISPFSRRKTMRRKTVDMGNVSTVTYNILRQDSK